MKLCIAGTATHEELIRKHTPKYILESYYYFKPWQDELVKKCDLFLLDSGAYTFMQNRKHGTDWDEYIKKYAQFIKNHGIKYFFELDIDSVIGYEKVKELRKRLENDVGMKCIPVWHKNRGFKEYEKLTEDYDYIAIGSFAIGEIKKTEYIYIKEMLKIANANNCKAHGLGFVSNDIEKYGFYSVDSTTWTQGRRYGVLNKFNGKKLVHINSKYKIKNNGSADEFNLVEYLRYQKYLERF